MMAGGLSKPPSKGRKARLPAQEMCRQDIRSRQILVRRLDFTINQPNGGLTIVHKAVSPLFHTL